MKTSHKAKLWVRIKKRGDEPVSGYVGEKL